MPIPDEDVLISFMSALQVHAGDAEKNLAIALALMDLPGKDARWAADYHYRRARAKAEALQADLARFLAATAPQPADVQAAG